MNLFLSNEIFLVLINEGIGLKHHISSYEIEVHHTKVTIILELPIPQKQKDVKSFLGDAKYCRKFIRDFNKIVVSLFILPSKRIEFLWTS
jgi:hypothetical protein